MGYITNFHMTVAKVIDGRTVILNKENADTYDMKDIYDKIACAFYDIWECPSEDFRKSDYYLNEARELFEDITVDDLEGKWYEYEEDMIKLSAAFPDFTFVLEGCGEERSDWWVGTWENGIGSVHYAKIIQPECPIWYDLHPDF